jgi:hypothetical protein
MRRDFDDAPDSAKVAAPNRQEQIAAAIEKIRATLASVPDDGLSADIRLLRMLEHHGAPLVDEVIRQKSAVPINFSTIIPQLPTRGSNMPVGGFSGVPRNKTQAFLHNAERLFYTESAQDELKLRRAMAEAHLYRALGKHRFDATPKAARNHMIKEVVEYHKAKGINPDYDTQLLEAAFDIPLPQDITADATKLSFLEGLTAGRGAHARY